MTHPLWLFSSFPLWPLEQPRLAVPCSRGPTAQTPCSHGTVASAVKLYPPLLEPSLQVPGLRPRPRRGAVDPCWREYTPAAAAAFLIYPGPDVTAISMRSMEHLSHPLQGKTQT